MEQDISRDKNFIIELILPLLGLSEDDILYSSKHFYLNDNPLTLSSEKKEKKDFSLVNNKHQIEIDYYSLMGVNATIRIDFKRELDDDSFKLFTYLFKSYHRYGKDISNKYFKNALINEKANELILQKGLFAYMLNDIGFVNNSIDKLFKCLQRWSEKTYEGHKVCYGFLINPNSKISKNGTSKNEYCGSFIDFIGEDYSAVFTDGITSIVEIDKDCEFINYRSILHSSQSLPDNLDGVKLPIRFAQLIYENVVGDKVGLFLLTNGDIIFAKKQAISFVRRGGRWLNLSHKAFNDIISEYIEDKNENTKKIIQAIYCSCLDISFAHTGGLIAVVNTKNEKWAHDLHNENPIVTKLDSFSKDDFIDFDITLRELYDKEKKEIDDKKDEKESIKNNLLSDLKKRLTKKRYLLQILKDNTYFPNIDRKLRADLSGLDGAIILDTDGHIIACGAIIANKSGSSGGGRGSAARTLSCYGGFAIKISTDGYIEAFFDGSRIYSIK